MLNLTLVSIEYHDMGSSKSRREHGLIGIEEFRGKLRLRIPREYCGGKQKALYTKLTDSNEGWKEARQLAWQIEQDINDGTFDRSLEKYKSKGSLSSVDASTALDLLVLWDKYTQYRKPQISETHYQENYCKRYRNAIEQLPSKNLKDAVEIRDYLLKNKTAATAKQLLIQFNAACTYAVRSKLIASNPFDGMATDIKVKRTVQAEDIDPFSPKEISAILKAFDEHPHHKHYSSFVRFLFLTGCRTSEAVGLQWQDVSLDCGQITFRRAISKKIRKGTKTGKIRKFPTSASLQTLLKSIRPSEYKPEDLVFPNPDGNPINPTTFIHNSWGGDKGNGKVGLVTKLVEAGEVERYRCQYNTRHTFITTCLEQGISISQVSRWVGSSPETIMRHYGGVIKQYQPPELALV